MAFRHPSRVRRTGLLLLVVALTACSGGDSAPDGTGSELLTKPGFGTRVAASIVTETDLEAQFQFGLIVRVEDGGDWLRLDLEQPYARYRRDPQREDEIIAEVVRETRERLASGISGAPFEDVRADVLPVLKPRFAVRELTDPATRPFPAGLFVIYGVHAEGQFTLITPGDVERWGRSLAEIDRLALDNLARETRENEALLCEDQLCGWASGDGYDATRMIVPQLRRDIVEEIGPAVYAVPREDVFVALPVRLAERIKARVLRDFTSAPNPISPEIFVERNGKLVTLEA